MIDGRGFDLAGTGGGREQEQREAVGPARNRHAEACARLDQGVEVGPEAIDERGIGDHLRSPILIRGISPAFWPPEAFS